MKRLWLLPACPPVDAPDLEGDPGRRNPYPAFMISQDRYPDLNHTGAKAFSDWLVSEKGLRMIDDFKIHGKRRYTATDSKAGQAAGAQ